MQTRSDEELRVVLDTNVLISYLWGSRSSEAILAALVRGTFRSVVSPATVAELLRVGKREKFRRKFDAKTFEEFTTTYEQVSLLVHPTRQIAVCRDQSDNVFLECAVASGADYLVTGDEHLLSIGAFEGTVIVTPDAFVEMVL